MYRKYDTNFQVWTDADLISSFGVLHNLSMQAEAKIADILNLPKYKKKKYLWVPGTFLHVANLNLKNHNF